MAVSFDHILLTLFLALLAWAAVSDSLSFRIPNAASLAIALLYPAYVGASTPPVDWIGAVATAAILFLIGFGLFAKGYAGGGDVKLLAAASLWAGPRLLPDFLFIMAMTGAILALATWLLLYLRRMKAAGIRGLMLPDLSPASARRIPYGIAIAAGAAYAGVQLMLA